MSSTSNVQNLLSNVFRPTFVYNTISNYYQTKLELVNIDTVSANTITAFALNVKDLSNNAYIGTGTGNPNSALDSSSNAGNTFVGTNAGASSQNVSNGVLVGYLAGSAAAGNGSISIGANTLNGGNSNIYIGYGTGISAGNNNIFIGPAITPASNTSNTLMIGNGATPTIIGDLAGRRIGIGLSSLPATLPVSLDLDVNRYARIGTSQQGGLGINTMPGSFGLDVNGTMRVSDGFGTLRFSNDASGISRTSISGIVNPGSSPAAVGIATLQVADGFFSASGVAGPIPLKRGLFMISAFNLTNYYAYIGIALSTSSQAAVREVSNATILTVVPSSISATTGTSWTITYFPSP